MTSVSVKKSQQVVASHRKLLLMTPKIYENGLSKFKITKEHFLLKEIKNVHDFYPLFEPFNFTSSVISSA